MRIISSSHHIVVRIISNPHHIVVRIISYSHHIVVRIRPTIIWGFISTDLSSVDSRITRSGEFIDSDDSSESGDFGEKYSNFSEPMFTYQ